MAHFNDWAVFFKLYFLHHYTIKIKKGKVVKIERGVGEEIKTGIMDESGTEVNTNK